MNQHPETLAEVFEKYCKSNLELFQGILERLKCDKRTKERELTKPKASRLEYQMGVYKDTLEQQVADAVLRLAEKGYRSFESGFNTTRGQYIGFYNRDIQLPDTIIHNFKEKGFDVLLEKFDDRSQIKIEPLYNKPVRLHEWKKISDEFAEQFPIAKKRKYRF